MRQAQAASPSTSSAWTGAAALFLDACLLIRNVFLYAIPGGLFFAIGLESHRITLAQVSGLLAPYHPPTWALGLLLVSACYVAGHLLSAIVSVRAEFWQLVHWRNAEWLGKYPTQVTGRDLVVRHYFPDLFRDMDRREASSRFVFSSIAGLLIGWLIFLEFQPRFADVVIGAAVLIFVATLTWISQLGRIRTAIHAAGSEIEAREKAAREAEAIIQPSPDELRFVIDSIFKAAELTSQKRRSIEPEGQPLAPDATPSGNGSAEQSSSARPASMFGLKL
ncbi:MAG TPA: hypothetical protein VFW94_12825 [Candidatus Acidoferrales bacterium]|nr:hypothetical protein [Candidatus Acidoferrales bacterium]